MSTIFLILLADDNHLWTGRTRPSNGGSVLGNLGMCAENGMHTFGSTLFVVPHNVTNPFIVGLIAYSQDSGHGKSHRTLPSLSFS